jgi:hypothetical protein
MSFPGGEDGRCELLEVAPIGADVTRRARGQCGADAVLRQSAAAASDGASPSSGYVFAKSARRGNPHRFAHSAPSAGKNEQGPAATLAAGVMLIRHQSALVRRRVYAKAFASRTIAWASSDARRSAVWSHTLITRIGWRVAKAQRCGNREHAPSRGTVVNP